MLSFGGRNRIVNIAIEDYVIRVVENNGKDLSSIRIVKEKEIPQNIIRRGKIIDELAFYDFMKTVVDEWKIKNRKVRFYAPHDLVIMRSVPIPEDVDRDEIREYITMEIGHSIHFPFTHPVFDLYDLPTSSNVEEVTVIAASEEELSKYINVFTDLNLSPLAVDIHALGSYRYGLSINEDFNEDQVFLFLEFNLSAVNIGIFHKHKLEFLRYQPLNIGSTDWESETEGEDLNWSFTGEADDLEAEINDQINDLSRLMNFYQYTLTQGEKAVNKIIVLGDHPKQDKILKLLKERYEQPIERLQVTELQQDIKREYIPLLGLALKGVK